MKFWLKALGVATAMAVTDAGWTLYMSAVTAKQVWLASLTAALIVLAGAHVVVSYVNDKRLMLAATVGAAVGTALTMMVIG